MTHRFQQRVSSLLKTIAGPMSQLACLSDDAHVLVISVGWLVLRSFGLVGFLKFREDVFNRAVRTVGPLETDLVLFESENILGLF